MGDIAMQIVIPFARKIGDQLCASTERHFGYLVHYNRHLDSFREELAKLQVKLSSLQDDIDSATRNGEVIRPEVTHWRTKALGFEEEALKFLDPNRNLNTKCFNGWFPNLVTRYNIGKEAKKKATKATKLLDEALQLASISSLPPPQGIDSMSSANFFAYGTTNVAISKVMDALKDENINFIGIHGMGGIGKTTLVKEVGKLAKEKKVFDEVVMVVVSQNIDIRKIQGQLAIMLGLHFGEEEENGRAGRLFARIKGVEKMLVILDDVWAKFDVRAAGIPFGDEHKGCKIVVTTRRLEVCRTMCDIGRSTKTKIVSVGVLTEQESWDLFGKNAGEVVENPNLSDVAREIAKECKGLPVAIVTVGGAMRGIDEPGEWKEALVELRRSVPRNIEGVEKNVFKCIKFSYDYLKNKEAERCFLLCSLFPEDYKISIELLVRYAVGLEIIDEVDIVEDVRGRVKLLIKRLKNSCLLIAGDDERYIKMHDVSRWRKLLKVIFTDSCRMNEEYIRMHDVVRDVGLSIGSEEYFVRAGVGWKEWPSKGILDHHNGVSLMENQIIELPCNFSGKRTLEILLLQGNKGCLWNDSLFEGMNKLRVLDMSYGRIPPMVGSGGFHLTCLQTLVLDETEFESSTSAIGEIKTLVVLSLRCCRFKESPSFIRNLTNLKLLDMSWCQGKIVFQRNSIACLTRLEELYLYKTITKWEFGKELNSLSRLKVLTFFVRNKKGDLPEDFEFPCNLESFFIGDFEMEEDYGYSVNNTLSLSNRIRGTIWWLNCFKLLLKKTHSLCLQEVSGESNIIPNLLTSFNDQSYFDFIKSLFLFGCQELEWIIDYPPHPPPTPKAFSNLQSLTLFYLSSFRGLCNGPLPSSVMSLSRLRELKIISCGNLSVAISPYSLLQRLEKLELLFVYSCGALERLFDFTELPGSKISHDVDLNLNLLVPNLRTVDVSECSRLKQLFPTFMALSLQKLESLYIKTCEEIREVVTNENGHALDHRIVFKSLKEITLSSLRNLNGFCMGSFPFEFPSLEQVTIKRCPKMKIFTAAVDIHIPKLKAIKLDGVEIMLQGGDLNTILQNHFKSKEMENASQTSN